MTTQYGSPSVCRPQMGHCILFQSSPDRGRSWHRSKVMPRRQCPPGKACRAARWQNDPVLAVSASRGETCAYKLESLLAMWS